MKLKTVLGEEQQKLNLPWKKVTDSILHDMVLDAVAVKKGKKSIDDASGGDQDWHRFSNDLCKLLKVSSTSRILMVDNEDDGLDDEKKFYDGAFQDVFGVDSEHGPNQNFKCPEGYTEKRVELSLHGLEADEDNDDVLDNDGIIISKAGKPKLFISYPYGAGIYLYWVK